MLETVKSELIKLVGEDRANDGPEDLIAGSHDASVRAHRPAVVLHPISTEEVSEIMKVANREEIPVTVRGSVTSPAAETVPVEGGILLAFSAMDKILEIDTENRTAFVQPGVINYDFQVAVEERGLMYPPDPSSWKTVTMGGTVGTNAGGLKTLKYGTTRDYLLGLTVVMANGDILKTGGRAIKNVTGYDLTRLMCGSAGTLALVTEMIVRLVPKPQASHTIRADFPTLESGAEAAVRMVAQGIVPSSLELLDKVVMTVLEEDSRIGLPTDREAMLLVEVDGDPTSVDIQAKRVREILEGSNAGRIISLDDSGEAEKLWNARRSVSSVMARLRPRTRIEAATVPVSNLTSMIRRVAEIAARHGLPIGIVAHAGGGNVHPVILAGQPDEPMRERVNDAIRDIFSAAGELGGTASSARAMNATETADLQPEVDDVAQWATAQIKESLDPKGILNPS